MPTKPHVGELLLHSRLHETADRLRSRGGFSEDIEASHAILFNPRYDRQRKIRAYRTWLENNQPCVFGKIAAMNKNVFICLLEEDEILRMRRGDQDLEDTIQDHRQVWKRLALEGLMSSFVILITSKSLITKEPNDNLKRICRRIMELYMQVSVPDDTFRTQREYVFLRRPENGLLKFSTLPNIFCAQGDGRWWHDHRTPGGIMITSNALGHFMYVRHKKASMDEPTLAWALENAMRTINNAQKSPSGGKTKFAHCPATFLVQREVGDPTPLNPRSQFAQQSPDHYAGYFHTDHLIPSAFFNRDRDPAALKRYDDLGLRYIYDPAGDSDHADLMAGTPATWYDVKRNMDRLPDFANPETTKNLDRQTRGRLASWLEERIQHRCN